jgi:hypothetical protein
MKKLVLILCVGVFVVAGVVSARTPTTVAPAKAAAPAKADVAKTHVVEAEVVSADASAKTLTVKTEKGESTMKVDTGVLTSSARLGVFRRAPARVGAPLRPRGVDRIRTRNRRDEHEAAGDLLLALRPHPPDGGRRR